MNDTEVQVLVTGSLFTGGGFRAIESVMEEFIRSARKEIQMAAYILAPSATGILNLLETALQRGVQLTIVVNRLEHQPYEIREQLKRLKTRFGYLKVIDFSDPSGSQLHAKVLIVDREKAIVGSANFTRGGMVANHEVALLIHGSAVWKLASLLDALDTSK